MTKSSVIIQSKPDEGVDITTRAQVVKTGDLLIQEGDVSGSASITCKVYDPNSTTPTTALAPSSVITIIVGSAIHDTPSTWKLDGVGYNFSHKLDVSLFDDIGGLKGGRSYRIEYRINLATEGAVFVVHKVNIQSMFG